MVIWHKDEDTRDDAWDRIHEGLVDRELEDKNMEGERDE
jgi:hypothetical protein